jgi:hypothetical protein
MPLKAVNSILLASPPQEMPLPLPRFPAFVTASFLKRQTLKRQTLTLQTLAESGCLPWPERGFRTRFRLLPQRESECGLGRAKSIVCFCGKRVKRNNGIAA